MNFIDAIRTCFRKYADFTGRAMRSEYWYFLLFLVIAEACLSAIYRPLGIAFDIAVFLPHLAVGARRLHDIDRTAWWLLLAIVPFLGWLILLIFFVQRGKDAPNRFGPPPLAPNIVAAGT